MRDFGNLAERMPGAGEEAMTKTLAEGIYATGLGAVAKRFG
ncbi:Uncharacterised protein [Mycobacterium tuberculosis]|nr:Uncharacterised protein [Mycobacterium tuberculosis]